MKVRAHQYDTVDALCWRHYGRTQGVTEQVLKANPGLGAQYAASCYADRRVAPAWCEFQKPD